MHTNSFAILFLKVKELHPITHRGEELTKATQFYLSLHKIVFLQTTLTTLLLN